MAPCHLRGRPCFITPLLSLFFVHLLKPSGTESESGRHPSRPSTHKSLGCQTQEQGPMDDGVKVGSLGTPRAWLLWQGRVPVAGHGSCGIAAQ